MSLRFFHFGCDFFFVFEIKTAVFDFVISHSRCLRWYSEKKDPEQQLRNITNSAIWIRNRSHLQQYSEFDLRRCSLLIEEYEICRRGWVWLLLTTVDSAVKLLTWHLFNFSSVPDTLHPCATHWTVMFYWIMFIPAVSTLLGLVSHLGQLVTVLKQWWRYSMRPALLIWARWAWLCCCEPLSSLKSVPKIVRIERVLMTDMAWWVTLWVIVSEATIEQRNLMAQPLRLPVEMSANSQQSNYRKQTFQCYCVTHRKQY